MGKQDLVSAIRDKTFEAIERTDHLIGLVPAGQLEWRPATTVVHGEPIADLGHLLGHLLDCHAGICAAFHAAFPSRLSDFAALRALKVNHSCQPEEARGRIASYSKYIARGFELCTDEDLGRKVPTVFAPQGEPLATILLGNLEHLLNHKYQLFMYLKLLGVAVSSADLYRWRSEGGEGTE
jgi:hypothetical protein